MTKTKPLAEPYVKYKVVTLSNTKEYVFDLDTPSSAMTESNARPGAVTITGISSFWTEFDKICGLEKKR